MFKFIFNNLENKTQKIQQTIVLSDAVSVWLFMQIELKYNVSEIYYHLATF